MSKTYRKLYSPVQFCDTCHKPTWQHTIQKYNLCECDPGRYQGGASSTGAYYKKDMKCPDGKEPWPNRNKAGTRKFCQNLLNRETRAKVKQELTNRNKSFDSMVFPTLKNGVLWELY